MFVRVLGPVEVGTADGASRLTGRRAALLTALVVADGGVLLPEQLIEWLWDLTPPHTARQQIHKVVAALRELGTDLVQTSGGGYRLDPDRVWCDTTEFRRLRAIGDITALTAALALFQGPVLAGLNGQRARAAAVSWEEHRLGALERLADLLIEDGRPQQAVAAVSEAAAAHPTRESMIARLMIALHRAGRAAEAIERFARLRTVLADELGADPGQEVAALHIRLLRGDGTDHTGVIPGLVPRATRPDPRCRMPFRTTCRTSPDDGS